MTTERRGWVSTPPDDDDWGRYHELEDVPPERGPFARLRALFGRDRSMHGSSHESGRRWYWRPFGGTAAVVLLATVLLAIPAVVAASWGDGFPIPSFAAPADQPGAAPGEPGLDFAAPAYPPFATPGGDASGGPDPLQPSGSGGPGASGPLPSPLPTPYPQGAGGAGTFVAVTGGGCPETANATYFAAYPAGGPVANLSGGWPGEGCTDRFWSVPMSGSTSADDPATYVLWWFHNLPIAGGTCGIWTYVPKGPRDEDVAGDPTFYEVLRGRDDRRVIGTFSVEQAPNRGTWAYGGAFDFDGGQIAVRLGNRGSGADGSRHGAAQILVNCAAG
jgi:hypothetical protein